MRPKIPPALADFSTDKGADFPASQLCRSIDAYVIALDIARCTKATLESRRERLSKLVWLCERRGWQTVGLPQLREFFHYLNHGHKEPGGRWGNPRETTPISSGRVNTYYMTLRAFFNWLVAEGEVGTSPMARIPAPIDRPDQIQPFTPDQARALINAAKHTRPGNYVKADDRTRVALRNTAIVLLLFDTGLRAGELCALMVGDVNLTEYQVIVREGKGGKSRTVPFSSETRRALFQYLGKRNADPSAALFPGERGKRPADALLVNGLRQLVERLGNAAGVRGVRCSPHTFRHTFAVNFLRAGGNVFTLRILLGHESLTMTNRYVALAQADIAVQHRRFSPVAWLNGAGKV